MGDQLLSLVKLVKGSSLLISGPASISLCDGAVLALGKKVSKGEGFIVQKGKSIPIEPIEDSMIEVKLGAEASIDHINDAIPSDWKFAVENIVGAQRPIKALVIGDVDSGKTTFAAYLSNMAFENGMKVAVIDADPGQAEISLPTTIGYGFLKSGVTSLHQVPLEGATFIGSTSTADAPMRVIVGARKLMDKCIVGGAELIVVNTCGWIYGKRAREYKTSLIQSLAPDFLIAIQRGVELESLLRIWEPAMGSRILRIKTSPASRVRSKDERKERREDAYQQYFAKSKERIFELQKVPLMYSYYTYGSPLPRSLLDDIEKKLCIKVFYGEGGDDFLFLVGDKDLDPIKVNKLKEITCLHDVILIPKGFERGIVIGLLRPDGEFAGLGVISDIDYADRKVTVLTPIKDEVGIIQVGQLKLNTSWRELARFPHYPI